MAKRRQWNHAGAAVGIFPPDAAENGNRPSQENGIGDIPGNDSIAWKETKAMLMDERFGNVTLTLPTRSTTTS